MNSKSLLLIALLTIFAELICSSIAIAATGRKIDREIVIAVVDDGFMHNLEQFKGMVWRNTKEIANNKKDDDSNGHIDDIMGWDASDQDGDVTPPKPRLVEYPHGTQMASIIARQIRQSLGEMNDYPIKLMFVKAISDTAQQLNMKDGYQGIAYAIENNADIVNLSWSGGLFNQQARDTLVEALKTNAFIVGSVGTYPQNDPVFPASHPAVFGVAGINSQNKLYSSNYGPEVDIAAFADADGPTILLGQDTATVNDGVSNSAALVTAAVALMKYANRSASNDLIKHCLQSTAVPLEEINPTIAGQLGSGRLDMQAAIACIKSVPSPDVETLLNAKASIRHSQKSRSKQKKREWQITPVGEYSGVVIKPFIEGQPKKSTFTVSSIAEGGHEAEIIWQGLLKDLPSEIETPHTALIAKLDINSNRSFKFQANYAAKSINHAEKYCHGVVEVKIEDASKPAIIEDGSGDQLYAVRSDCKWHVVPKPDHDLILEFLELDTELNVDPIYLFRGDSTRQTDLLMRITGAKLPPKIIIEGSPALLWFTSDNQNQGQGFKVRASIKPSVPD